MRPPYRFSDSKLERPDLYQVGTLFTVEYCEQWVAYHTARYIEGISHQGQSKDFRLDRIDVWRRSLAYAQEHGGYVYERDTSFGLGLKNEDDSSRKVARVPASESDPSGNTGGAEAAAG